MTYEEKREKVIYAIVEAHKFASKGVKPLIDGHNEYFEDTTLEDIARILRQFEDEEKLKVISQTTSSFEDMFDFEDANLFTIDIFDIEYFKKLLPKPSAKLNIDDSPMRKMGEITNYISGTTEEERARIRAIESQGTQPTPLKNTNSEYFIEYRDDRTILLNGKIDIGRPRFNTQSEILFSFLYKHPNETFTLEQLEKETNMEILDKLPKLIDRMGFRRGLKKAFFDIHENTINCKKTTVRFRSKITL